MLIGGLYMEQYAVKKSYSNLFKEFINQECVLSLLVDIKTGDIFKGVFKDFPLVYLDDSIDTVCECSLLRGQMVKLNECFYIVLVKKSYNLKMFYIVPQTELFIALQDKRIYNLFDNIDSVSFKSKKIILKDTSLKRQIWYHGTHRKHPKSINDMNPNQGGAFGDFGRGAYLTNSIKIANGYALNPSLRRTSNSHVIGAYWCNDDLNTIFNKIKEEKDKKKSNIYTIQDNVGNKYNVLVFMNNPKDWYDALWEGWIEGKRQDKNGYIDMVLGPLSYGEMPQFIRICKTRIEKGQNINEIKSDFYNCVKMSIDEETENINYQICVYNENMLKHFEPIRRY